RTSVCARGHPSAAVSETFGSRGESTIPGPFRMPIICSRAGSRWGARNDDRDIVRSASSIRQPDKNLAGLLGIARFDHDAMNVLVFDVIDEAIAAEQDAVTGLHGQASDVRRHLLVDSEGHRDDVFPRVVL